VVKSVQVCDITAQLTTTSQHNSSRYGSDIFKEVHTMFETLFKSPGILHHHKEGTFAAERAAYLAKQENRW
jgi:hypothetical protein